MGFPLSRFSMMAELCRHDSFVSEKLSRFKAVCIVLHDPDDLETLLRIKSELSGRL